MTIAENFDAGVLAFIPEKDKHDVEAWIENISPDEDVLWKEYLRENQDIFAGADWSRCERPDFCVVFADGSVLVAYDEWGSGPSQICGVERYPSFAEARRDAIEYEGYDPWEE